MKGPRLAKPADEAAEVLLDADAAVADATEDWDEGLAGRILSPIADLGDQPAMRILCGSVIAVGLIGGDRRLARTGLRMLAAHTLATVAKDFVKRRVDRTRPRAAKKKGKHHKPKPGRNEAKEESSFPSGHAAGAAAVARAFARAYPEYAAPAAAGGALLSLAQIPRCAHYPTDTGAGVAIGLAAEGLVNLGFNLFEGEEPAD